MTLPDRVEAALEKVEAACDTMLRQAIKHSPNGITRDNAKVAHEQAVKRLAEARREIAEALAGARKRIHVYPRFADESQHQVSPSCWCHPEVCGEIVVHRRPQ